MKQEIKKCLHGGEKLWKVPNASKYNARWPESIASLYNYQQIVKPFLTWKYFIECGISTMCNDYKNAQK